MKKILIGLGIFLGIIVVILVVGVQFGNVTIGRQSGGLKTEQVASITASAIYQKHFNSDKLIVLNYWATWCEPCIGEMPALNSVKDKYQNQEVEFLSFSIDTDSLKLVKFNNSKRFHFTDVTFENLPYKTAIQNFLENRPLEESINMQSVPITYLIQNKKVIKKFDGTVESDELILAIDAALKSKG